MFKKILSVITISAVLLAPFLALAATNQAEIDALNKEIEARKDKIKQLESTMGTYQKNIEVKRTEAVSLKNQMSIISNRVAQIEVDVNLTKEKLKQTELEIDALTLSIKDKQNLMDRQKAIVAKIIQNLHVNDQKNFMEIMLTNANLADFYNQATYLENVYSDLGKSVKNVRLAKADLENKKLQVENRRALFEELKNQLENKQQDLNEQVGVKTKLLGDTQTSEMKYRTLLDSLRQQYRVIEGEVRVYEDQVRKKLAEQERFKEMDSGSGELSWPVSSRYITASFHDPDYPYRQVFEHSGVDIRAAQGTAIKAAASGYIGRAKRCSSASCYSYILIIHSGNISTVYGHLSAIKADEDQYVNRGDIIGYSGGTPGTPGAGPFVTGPHLHFEVRQNGIPVNPMGYLQ